MRKKHQKIGGAPGGGGGDKISPSYHTEITHFGPYFFKNLEISSFVNWLLFSCYLNIFQNFLSMSSNRFIPHSEDDIQRFVDTEANENTKKNTANGIALVKLFIANEGETSAIDEIPPACRFRSILI
jgi:hypothetical protein